MSGDMDAPRYFLGVDGGGVKTRAIVVDAAGVERGSALGGSANAHRVGVAAAISEIIATGERAASVAGARLPLAAAWLGLAGMDSPGDAESLRAPLASLAGVVQVTNDAELLLSALPGQIGVALIAGAGSIAIGRNASGEVVRIGGWGHILGDEGSGYYLGRCALIAAARSADGRGERTSLLARILAAWGLDEAHDLIGRVYGGEVGAGDTTQIARLAPMVLEAAREGDRVARRIVHRGAVELARAAVAAGERLGLGAAPLPLALGGSLLLRADDYRATALGAIARRYSVGPVACVESPALSAARAAIVLSAASVRARSPMPICQE